MIEQLHLDTMDIEKYCVTDNAANMIKAIRESRYLERYPCDIHTLNLCVDNTFEQVEGMNNVNKKCKALSKLTHQSTSVANEQLKAMCKKLGIKYKKLKNPNDTRWNSQYTNLESVLYLKTALQTLANEDETDLWSTLALTAAEWKMVQGAVTVLKPFLLATKAWEAEKTPTINLVIERVYTMHQDLTDFCTNPRNCRFDIYIISHFVMLLIPCLSRYGIMFARTLQTNLEMRFPDRGMDRLERCVGNYLDPRFKGIHLSLVAKLGPTKQRMEERWGVQDVPVLEGVQVAADLSLSPTSKLLMGRRETLQQEGSALEREMVNYEKRFGNPGRNADILTWWKLNQEELPLLSKIARTVLSIPASSAKSERVFSTGGNVVTAKRSRLLPSKAEDLIILKENRSKVEEFKKYTKLKIDDEDADAFGKIKVQIIEGHNKEVQILEADDSFEIFDEEEEDEITLEDV